MTRGMTQSLGSAGLFNTVSQASRSGAIGTCFPELPGFSLTNGSLGTINTKGGFKKWWSPAMTANLTVAGHIT